MTENKGEKDILDRLQEELNQDGTHPDFPERRFFRQEDWARVPWSDLAFELPALAVYSPVGENAKPVIGVVIALSHTVGGTRILIRSRHNGEIRCHPIEESPSGLKPSYLLVKEHLPMAGIP
jgi:hypothetical protein